MMLRRLLTYLIAFAIGILPAFFVVFNAIFSDVFSLADRLLTYLLTLIAYGILGLTFGFLSRSLSWKWSIWLTLPALVIAILYSFNESGRWLLHLSYPLLAFAAAAAAATAGSRLRSCT